MAATNKAPIVFPSSERQVQSRYLYLQSAGSTGADGSTHGAHVRWLLAGNLGDTHIPKGDAASTRVNFNRRDDFVSLLRSEYVQRFPTYIDFAVSPDAVNDAASLWIYTRTNTNTVVYIHFRDTARYAAVRNAVDPKVAPLEFVRQYGPGVIEAEVKDKLFFAAEIDVDRDPLTIMRAEALSVESNVPLSPLFVSCRKVFTNDTWCPPAPPDPAKTDKAIFYGSSPACCSGPNLLSNGGFESAASPFGFDTDYSLQAVAQPGAIVVTSDASLVNPPWWRGLPHSGTKFLAVDGTVAPERAVLRFRAAVERGTDYCLNGWLSLIDLTVKAHPPVPLQVRFKSAGGVQAFDLATPGDLDVWKEFTITWNSGQADVVVVELLSLSHAAAGNDFGIDDLWFCRGAGKEKCLARIRSENIRSIRFDVNNGHPLRLELETYDDYMTGAQWQLLDRLALTADDGVAFSRLEPVAGAVNGHWQKFNDNALVNVANYQARWTNTGGLREGVQKYIANSDTDPRANEVLSGPDGTIEISLLDALRMVSLDFHVARMLGLGYLDATPGGDSAEFIYLGMYDTEGPLDDGRGARLVRHYYMGVPTRPLDYRLPDPPVLGPVNYGLSIDNGEPQSTLLTDANGYTPDGLARYVNLFAEPDADTGPLQPFFVPPDLFCAIDKTSPVFYGVEYRKQGEGVWRKPEIAHDAQNKDLDTPPQFETLPLPNNNDLGRPILRHEERENGVHEYGGYGINWFSRASAVGNVVATDSTKLEKAVTLLPPANFMVQLIQSESPLMLTTTAEQVMLNNLTGPDKTLVRVTFDYHHVHDINYAFADTVELFFRPEMPRNVAGAVKSMTDDPSDSRNAVIQTRDYPFNSLGTVISPALAPALYGNFAGGVLTCQQENYIIISVSAPSVPGDGPVFTVKKNVKGNASDPGGTGTFLTVQDYVMPDMNVSGSVMFMAVENMADATSWGLPNPLAKTITIGDSSWTEHQETYQQDGTSVTISLRGIWRAAAVTKDSTLGAGMYRIEFTGFTMPHHPQFPDVDWYKGIARIERASDPNAPRKVLDVLLIASLTPLVLYAHDGDDGSGDAATGASIMVNYYQGYRAYLQADSGHHFDGPAVNPAPGEGTRRTWLGARSRDTALQYSSPVGIPAPVIAVEHILPLAPGPPRGADYATWPDFYFKSSYTFVIGFDHEPFSAAMYRANDAAILRALYSDATYDAVTAQLDLLGEDDPYRADRWRNLLGFDYIYDVPGPAHPYFDPTGSSPNDTFRKFPAAADGYSLPNPDKPGTFTGVNPGSVLPALREAIWGAFTALTELPLIYQLIKGPNYEPVPRAQNIRNSQGALLDPSDPEFDLAPMAKRTANPNEIQFTDFTLDGAGSNLFFYCGREIGNRGRLGDPGPIAGPVQLINTRPPEAPAIKRMYVREPDFIKNIGPSVQFEVNAYPEVQKVRRMLIYRATEGQNALSVRTMELVKTVDLKATNQIGKLALSLADDFENGFVPYGDPLYYRIVALRKVKKPGGGTDWAPSQPSKLLLTTMIDVVNPEPPQITWTSNALSGTPATLTNVALSWPPTAYNGTYYLDKMTSAGNWQNIHQIRTNVAVTVNLAATALGTDVLPKEDEDEQRPIYNRFRVRVENSSGLFNLIDSVLTI